jgi:hypothetical protein
LSDFAGLREAVGLETDHTSRPEKG